MKRKIYEEEKGEAGIHYIRIIKTEMLIGGGIEKESRWVMKIHKQG